MADKRIINSGQNNVLWEKIGMEKCSCLIKTIAVITCLALFFVNNFVIFQQFASRKSVTAMNYKYQPTLLLPVIIICNGSAYKNPRMSSVDLEYYLNNTFKLFDALDSITSGEEGGSSGQPDEELVLYNSTYKSKFIHIDSIFTYYRGHCYSVKYRNKVMSNIYKKIQITGPRVGDF